jgi:FkbM family methyltransferase
MSGATRPADRRKALLVSAIIGFGVFAALGLVAFVAKDRVRILAVRLLLPSSRCSSYATRQTQERLAAEIKTRSKLLRRENGFELWQTPRGMYWIPEGSISGLTFTLAEQVRDIYENPEHRVNKGDVVLDCGAAVGVFVRTALSRGAGRVVAIEPSPNNVECLRRNFAREIQSGRVIVYPKGVWNREETLKMRLHQNSVLDTFVMKDRPEGPETGEVSLPVTTIDRIVEELGLERVDFVKMDVEGAEQQAIAGAQAVLLRFQPVLAIATENLPGDEHRIPEAVKHVNPRYVATRGSCMPKGFGVRPEVVYFRVPQARRPTP